MARQVLENGVILPAEYSDDWYDDMTSNLTKLDDVIGSDSEKLSSADVGAAALSNNYNDLDNLPTIPTVNDATLTIQKNGVDVQTFTANASSNVTCNITVPTKTSDLTNDSNFVDTSNSAVASGITSAKVTSYDSHIADTDIHVTTADKTKWNNGVSQAYVFRYSSTTLVASSTNSNTLLDNTDNLKVGDKVIDSSGVLFSITAIDSVNSTFTIGTALIDLAQDSDVVHKSGNETINGELTVTKLISNSIQSDTGNIQIQSSGSNRSVAVYNGSSAGDGGGFWAYGKDSANGSDCRIQIYNTTKSRYERVDLVGSQFLPTPSGELDCGGTLNKWKSVYATEYYYGNDNVEFSTKFVTTDTNQTISGNKTFDSNTYIYNSDNTANTPYLFLKNSKTSKGNTSEIGGQLLRFIDKNNNILCDVESILTSTGSCELRLRSNTLDSNNQNVQTGVTLISSSNGGKSFCPTSNGNVLLGDNNLKWSDVKTNKINALEPSSLSLPSGNVSDVIDISSYLVNLDGTDNTYVAPSNGWITINMNNCSGIHAIITGFWGDSRIRASAGAIKFLMPVLKNQTVTLTIHGGTINNARFIPCQGNV